MVGLVTFLFAGTLALVMTDLKRVLAYSTISHLGLMMLSLGALSVAAAMLHLVAHGVSKALLFLGAGSVTHGTEKTDIREMGGLVRAMPITAITFVIGAASLAGLVPLSGFFSKDEIMLAVLDHRHPVLLIAALGGSVLSAVYMARLALVVCFGRNRGEGAHESPWLMTLPLAVLAPFAVMLGLIAYGWSDSYTGFGGFLVGGGVHHAPLWLPVLSALLVLGGLAYGWRTWGRGKVTPFEGRDSRLLRLLENKYYVDEAYQWAIDRIALAFSRFIALFDRVVVNDTGVDGPAWSIMLSAVRMRLAQTGRLYNYGLVMALGVLGLSALWWLVLAGDAASASKRKEGYGALHRLYGAVGHRDIRARHQEVGRILPAAGIRASPGRRRLR